MKYENLSTNNLPKDRLSYLGGRMCQLREGLPVCGQEREGEKMTTLTELENIVRLRYQDKSCTNCRYFRVFFSEDGNSADTSECLLLGRTMGIGEMCYLYGWGRGRICDGWKKRPKTWNIDVSKNPHFHDPYLTRKYQQQLRRRVGRKGGGKIEIELNCKIIERNLYRVSTESVKQPEIKFCRICGTPLDVTE